MLNSDETNVSPTTQPGPGNIDSLIYFWVCRVLEGLGGLLGTLFLGLHFVIVKLFAIVEGAENRTGKTSRPADNYCGVYIIITQMYVLCFTDENVSRYPRNEVECECFSSQKDLPQWIFIYLFNGSRAETANEEATITTPALYVALISRPLHVSINLADHNNRCTVEN